MEDRSYKIDRDFLVNLRDMMLAFDNELFEEDCDNLECFIYRLNHDFNDDKSNGRKTMSYYRENMKQYYDYRVFYPYVRKLMRSNLLFERSVCPTYKDLVLRDKDAIDIARDFFSKQGSFFSKPLEEFVEEDIHDHLEFIEPNRNTDGEMCFMRSTEDAFVIVPDYDNLTKVTILIHELEHVIDCFNNHGFYNNKIIRECSSMFMEMISTEFVGKLFDFDMDPYLRRMAIHSIIKLDTRYIYFKNQLLHLGNKHKDLNSSNLRRKINHYGFNRDDISRLNDTYLINDYYYQISYLIAIELYNIYKQDKERALNILKTIVLNGNDKNILSILSSFGITLCSSLLDYEEELYLKLQR